VAACAGIFPRDVKRRDLRIGGARECEPDLNAATRYLRTAHRDQNPAVPPAGQNSSAVADIQHRDRTFNTLRERGQVLAEAASGIAGIGDANDEKVVALAHFASDSLGIERLVLASDDVDLCGPVLVCLGVERSSRLSRPFDRPFELFAVGLCADFARRGAFIGFITVVLSFAA
jgi:hypothetical protein